MYPCATSLHVFLPTLCNYILRSYQESNLNSIVRSDKFFQLNYKTSCRISLNLRCWYHYTSSMSNVWGHQRFFCTPDWNRTSKPERQVLSLVCLPFSPQGHVGCKNGTAPSSQDSQSCASLKSFEHHIVPTSGNDPLWKYLWDIFDHLIKSVFEESIVLETNPFYRAIALAGHPNTLSVYFPFCTPRRNWTSISSLSEMCANHSTIGAILRAWEESNLHKMINSHP